MSKLVDEGDNQEHGDNNTTDTQDEARGISDGNGDNNVEETPLTSSLSRSWQFDADPAASLFVPFTDSFPGPVDVVLFSNILHDWPDETNVHLINKAYQCLAPGGRIVISELFLSDDVKSSTVSSTSMNIIMLPYTKGRQYRAKELFRRLERAGFAQPHVTKLVDDYDLVIATKPE